MQLRRELDVSTAAEAALAIRRRPPHPAPDTYTARRICQPGVSTQVYIDTDRGTSGRARGRRCAAHRRKFPSRWHAGVSSTVSRAPRWCRISSCRTAIRAATVKAALATLRDELNERAVSARRRRHGARPVADSGGSQYSSRSHPTAPRCEVQPSSAASSRHGGGRADPQWDVIRRVRVWDGQQMTASDRIRIGIRFAVEIERGATAAPFICGRGQLTVSCRPSSSRPWLSSPLSFIPPFNVGFSVASAHVIIRGCRLARSPDVGARPSGHRAYHLRVARASSIGVRASHGWP